MTTAAEFDKKYDIVDEQPPRHALMTGRYKKSFAYYTLRERLPVILTGVIDGLNRDKDELAAKYGEESREELKTVVGQLSKLKYELQTDKTFETFKNEEPDAAIWNEFIESLADNKRSYFKSCWLYSECYLYRRMRSFFEATKTLKNFDHFAKQKQTALTNCTDSLVAVLDAVRKQPTNDEQILKHLVKLNLWGNRFDLSITTGKEIRQSETDPFEQVKKLDTNLLVDETALIWKTLEQANKAADGKKPIIVDFVCDNAGYEFFTDLVLADYILSSKLAQQVRYNVKSIPWFISDVTPDDFNWTVDYLSGHELPQLSAFGKKLKTYIAEKKIVLSPVHYFWTSPYEFYKMSNIAPDLYKQLGEASLVIFKGDLNYRKLLGDYTWDDTEYFLTCIRGFLPTNICTLRTVKADLICGLELGTSQKLFQTSPDWMLTGEYGVIQYAAKEHCGCTK